MKFKEFDEEDMKEWESERDADLLMEYATLKSDKERLEKAIKVLKEKKKDIEETIANHSDN